ncbi:Alternative cytochrome c oxidase polypeptide CoxM [Collimonas arenae]|uniref:cytochrome-c oxidase n=1 Tax=Collimonas arenae TaxID=279058 RepID=A0A0A1FH71_9BURK|nr:cytochrome c oxidase subunit II [Collimonas arenae]AIY42222.1 Alternative cytochrome c oxidase polypeptide CoxM [Collimonas arenae]
MAMAVALVLIVVASVLFHFFSPWWATPLASNWRQMDDTLTITLVITGIFFVVINLFIVYILLRFRHREGQRAAYQPDNRKLERWLIIGTSIAIMGLLAPGLFVYAAYVTVPANAVDVEVVGQQWQWRFRYPGASGKLGRSSVALISASNPFGVDPADPAGQDNILINNNELHLQVNQPVRLLLRSLDVLHDFFVPPFRARMNMVPGMVTSFWFTPDKIGRYEVLCAQLCGVGHAGMRGYVVVEDAASFQKWLKAQPTFAQTMAPPVTNAIASAAATAPIAGDALVAQGKALSESKACVACHTVDGTPRVGPTWKGLYGKTETMESGATALVDEAYLKTFIRNPQARVVKGFAPMMPKIEMSDAELEALVAYIKSVGAASAATPKQQAQQ